MNEPAGESASRLTGRQKSFLRGLGQRLRPTCAVGKAGLAAALAESIREQLAGQELIKVRLPAGPGAWRRKTAEKIAQLTDSQCAGVTGRTALLYRANPELPPERRVPLP